MSYQVHNYVGGRIWLDVTINQMVSLQSKSLYETDKLEAMAGFLKPGMTFVDAGACFGYFSLYAARLVGPEGKVWAFEPEPVNCAWLRKSVYLNRHYTMNIYERALGNETGDRILGLTAHPGQHSLVPKNKPEFAYPVQVCSLDSIAGDSPVDAMKIDVQGYEIQVLQGGKRTLSVNRDMLLMVDLHPSLGVDCDKVEQMIVDMGFRVLNRNRQSIIARKDKQ